MVWVPHLHVLISEGDLVSVFKESSVGFSFCGKKHSTPTPKAILICTFMTTLFLLVVNLS